MNFNFYLTPKAANEPVGIDRDGCLRSPLMFIPAKTPVTAGKKTPKMPKNPVLSLKKSIVVSGRNESVELKDIGICSSGTMLFKRLLQL